MSFHVGQKVVCICTDNMYPEYPNRGELPSGFQKGAVYTIREIDPRYLKHIGECGVRLEEFIFPRRGSMYGPIEPAFPASRFRPLIERKTSIEIFERMLDPDAIKRAREKVGVD